MTRRERLGGGREREKSNGRNSTKERARERKSARAREIMGRQSRRETTADRVGSAVALIPIQQRNPATANINQ